MAGIRTQDIKSVTAFRANIRRHLTRLKASGRPEVLTVNGEAQGVVMSPDAYQRLVDDAEYGRSIRLIRQSIEEFNEGKSIPADVVFAELRAKLDDGGK